MVVLAMGLGAGRLAAQPTCPPLHNETQALTTPYNAHRGMYGVAFGYDVAVDGDVMAIGMPYGSRIATSIVAVYERMDNVWVHVQDLVPPDGIASHFGKAVAVSGSRILVGDPYFGGLGGAVFLFEKQGGAWVPHADNPIRYPRLMPQDAFGFSVAISGDRFVVGAPLHDTGYTVGMAFLYILQNGSWSGSPLVPSSNDYGRYRYGHSVAIDGVLIAVGAPDDIGRNGEPAAGRVSVFEDIGSWRLTKRLAAPTSEAGAQFGTSVAVSGQEILIGEPYRSGHYVQGQAYLFERDAAQADKYHHTATLVADYYCSGGYTAAFGYDVAFNGDTALIGSPENASVGLAYLFKRRPGGRWVEKASYTAANLNWRLHRGARFGHAVAVSGETSVVGAPYYGTHGAGGAFVYDAVRLGLRRHAAPATLTTEAPPSFSLDGNYPNPFNPSTTIAYTIPEAARVTLEVYDMTGRRVQTLVDAYQEAGSYEVPFEAHGLPSGAYLYRVRAGTWQATHMMTLIK